MNKFDQQLNRILAFAETHGSASDKLAAVEVRQCLKEERDQATSLIDLEKRQCRRMLKDRADHHQREINELGAKLDSSQEDYERAMHRVSQLEASEEKLRAELVDYRRRFSLAKHHLEQEQRRVSALASEYCSFQRMVMNATAEPACCGRPGIECCGSPEPYWPEWLIGFESVELNKVRAALSTGEGG